MARLLLVTVAAAALLAGLLAMAAVALGQAGAVHAAIIDPALAAALRPAVLGAALVAALSVPVSLAGALGVWRSGKLVRMTVGALAVLALMAPAAHFTPPAIGHATPADLMRLGGAVTRGTAAALLVLMAGLGRVPAGQRRAAMLAGARPGQAWRHAVLAPLAPYLLAALAAAMAAGLATGPAFAVLAPHVDLARAWLAPAALLLATAGLAALASLLTRNRAPL